MAILYMHYNNYGYLLLIEYYVKINFILEWTVFLIKLIVPLLFFFAERQLVLL